MRKKIVYAYLSGIEQYKLYGCHGEDPTGKYIIPYIECQTDIYPEKDIKTEFVNLDTDGWLRIKAGFLWDGASGPTIDTESTMRPSCNHDALYWLMLIGMLRDKNRKKADKELRKQLREDGMGRFRAWYWYHFVRAFGGSHARK